MKPLCLLRNYTRGVVTKAAMHEGTPAQRVQVWSSDKAQLDQIRTRLSKVVTLWPYSLLWLRISMSVEISQGSLVQRYPLGAFTIQKIAGALKHPDWN